jgi:hypothetical protein
MAGFFEKSVKHRNTTEAEEAPTQTWLSRLSSANRRASMGFNDSMSTSMTDENSSDNTNSTFLIPKMSSAMESSDVFSPGEDAAHGMNNLAMTSQADQGVSSGSGGVLTIIKGHIMLDEVTAAEIANYETMTKARKKNNLSDKVSTAVNMGNFPVATKESLAQLGEMKRRSQGSDEDEAVFSMDTDEQETDSSSRKSSRTRTTSEEPDKPPSKMASYLLKKGFAQNWFFKSEDAEDGVTSEAVVQQPPTRPPPTFMFEDTDNASFGFDSKTENSRPVAASDFSAGIAMFNKQDAVKKKQHFRDVNFIAPQNL